MIKLLVIYLFVFITFSSCEMQIKFDKIKWQTKEYPEAPPQNRKKMLRDLTTNYKLIALSKNDLIKLLGEPNYPIDSVISYLIEEDYGNDIDPVYTKHLNFYLTSDSIVKDFKVEEWKK